MSWLARFLRSAFGMCVVACLGLAGWAVWSAGLLDGPIAAEVRTTSVYAAPGVDVDEEAAERIIGNRRLVVLLLEPDADLRAGCQSVTRAAAGTLVVVLSPTDDGYDRYGCSRLDSNLGQSMVMETRIAQGIDEFADRPLEALKLVVLNYDVLVKTGTIPDGPRTISPSLPRYLVAAAAVVTVVLGSAAAYLTARRAGRLTARYLSRRAAVADDRRELSAATAVLAEQIIDLDRRYSRLPASAGREYRRLAAEYAELAAAVAAVGDLDRPDLGPLIDRVERLTARCRRLAQADHETRRPALVGRGGRRPGRGRPAGTGSPSKESET